MAGASSSLLQQARAQDPAAFQRLLRIYGPLVYTWARKANLQASDAADIVQEVFATVWSRMGDFQGERNSVFRSWLWTISRNKIYDLFRRAQADPQAEGGTTATHRMQELPENPCPEESLEGQEECTELRLRAIQEFRDGFESHVWQAFWRVVVEDRAPTEVARELRLSVWVVYKSKARVLQRLRQQLDGLVRIDA